jgi:hypothetical protein
MCNHHAFKERRRAFTSEVATILALKWMRDVPVLHVQTGDGKRLNVWEYIEGECNRGICCDVYASNMFHTHTHSAVTANFDGHLDFKEERGYT